jgi:multicomponent Na+:H+ antiporter subunit B
MILKNILKILTIFIVSFGIYIQIQAEDAIGGGFQSGLVFASCLILYSIAYDKSFSINLLKKIASIGAIIYFSVGVISMLKGGSFLNYSYLLKDKLMGQELGIFMVEIGVAFTVFSAISAIYLMVKSDD